VIRLACGAIGFFGTSLEVPKTSSSDATDVMLGGTR